MGPIARSIVDDMKRGDLDEYRHLGFKITDERFAQLEAELDGRHSTHGWDGVPPEVSLFGVRLFDDQARQRRWPKAFGPHPCATCSGTGFTDWNVDGTRFPGAADCPDCDGSGVKAAAAKFGAAVRDAIAKDRSELKKGENDG